MKKKVLFTAIIGLLLLPFMVYGQTEQATSNSPPVAQPLVREGELAVRLVGTLKIGSAQDEAEAETMLTAIDIVPKNGWIADYPVTPEVLGELQSAVSQAADSNQLPMKRDEALKALENLTTELGLSVVSDTSIEQAAVEPPQTYPDYINPTVINNYYYNEGPPVVTYYPPPPDYWYLYSWCPYPFWHSGFFFRGFFVLHDFHRVIIVNKRRAVVSNHVFDHKHRRFYTIDPVKRYRRDHGGIFRNDREIFQRGDRRSSEWRRGADSIMKRSFEQRRSNGPGDRNFDTVRPRTRAEERSPRVSEPRTVERRGDNLRRDSTVERRRDSMIERERGRNWSGPSFRGERNRNFNPGPSIREERGRKSDWSKSSSFRRETRQSENFRGRSFNNAPSRNVERSFGSNHRGRGNGCRGRC